MYVIYGPYILALIVAIAAIITSQRDLASTTQFRFTMGSACAVAILWTGLLVALLRSDL
jgi:hypothetical protein